MIVDATTSGGPSAHWRRLPAADAIAWEPQNLEIRVTDLTARNSHFEFGENWADFAKKLTPEHVASAVASLEKLLPGGLGGASFLDIGCGSGLSSVAAARLGAGRIEACDIDENSVRTTEQVLAKFAGEVPSRVRVASVFDLTPEGQGLFDVVHSWGVLHHTGDMSRAVRCAAALVRPGGLLVVALYNKTPLCGAWTIEKRFYARAPRVLQKAAQVAFVVARLPAQAIAFRRSPVALIRDYRATRGMDYWNDVHDWLGGYPYESATPDEADAMVGAEFTRERAFITTSRLGLFGSGCNEFVYRRQSS